MTTTTKVFKNTRRVCLRSGYWTRFQTDIFIKKKLFIYTASDKYLERTVSGMNTVSHRQHVRNPRRTRLCIHPLQNLCPQGSVSYSRPVKSAAHSPLQSLAPSGGRINVACFKILLPQFVHFLQALPIFQEQWGHFLPRRSCCCGK